MKFITTALFLALVTAVAQALPAPGSDVIDPGNSDAAQKYSPLGTGPVESVELEERKWAAPAVKPPPGPKLGREN